MRRRRSQRRTAPALALATALVVALLSAPAAGAAVFTLSADPRAEHPDVEVDANGTAHVVWTLSGGIATGDVTVYCRIPSGAKACALTREFPLSGTDFNGPRVVITNSGAIVLVSGRCCFPASPVYAITSNDGGESFGPPVTIADEFAGGVEWDAVLGPGDFSLALSGGNSGPDHAAIWRAAPLDGGVPSAKAELSSFPRSYFNSTGFPAPTQPIAVYTDLESVFMRRWSGGDYNNAASWLPESYVLRGNEPKLASGVNGTFLIYLGAKPPYQYFVRRFDGSGFPKASQKVVSDPGTDQSAIFRDFIEDPDGNLHAVFFQEEKAGAERLRHRVSVDGNESWKKAEVLAAGAAADDLFNPKVSAGPDGAGGVVGDHNSEGPVWFAPFGPVGKGSGACPPTVKLGKAVARALQGCFKRNGGAFVASGPVKLNGVDVEPASGGGGARASVAFHVTAVPGQRTLTTSGPVTVRVGEIVLDRGPLAWKLPAGNGKVLRLDAADGSVFKDLGKYAKKIFDFPVDGDAELTIAGGGVEVPVDLRMPGILGGVTGKTTLRTNAGGQVFGGMRIDVPTAAIGILHIAGIDVSYDGADRFSGEAKISLPPAYSGAISKSSVRFGFEDGDLSLLEVKPPPFNPPLPIVGAPPSPLVGLDQVIFSYVRKPASRLFQGELILLAGPRVAGFRVVDMDGTVALEFPDSDPATLSAHGDLRVVKVPLGSAFVDYTFGLPGSLAFGGQYDVLGVHGGVKGHVDLGSGDFSASGGAALGPLSGQMVITDEGLGACLDNPLGPDPGVSWQWSSPTPKASCPGSVLGRASASAVAGAAKPALRASVRGKGRKRTLRYRARLAAGQRVTFAEEARRAYREIGSARKGRGDIGFRPAPGPGGKRRIVAIVEQGGVPISKTTVARYRAPGTPRARAPRRVAARRAGRKLVVGWSRVRGAAGYAVRVDLPRDGRRLLFFPPPRRHGLRVRGLERSDLARVSVAALGPDLRAGNPTKAKLKPAAKK